MSRAFTLVELLVVMTIILILASLIFAVVTAGGTSQDQQDTKALIITVSAAIDQFTNETGSVPLPTGSQADPQSGSWYPAENDGSWEKQQLWWRLSKDMTAADNSAMKTAAEAADLAADPYQSSAYMASVYSHTATRAAKIKEIMDTIPDEEADYYKFTYSGSDWDDNADRDVRPNNASLTRRGQYKSYFFAARGAIAKDLEQRKYMTYACLELEDMLNKEFVQDNTIVDSWGMPLVYAAHSTIRIKERRSHGYCRYYGLQPTGRTLMTDRNKDDKISLEDWNETPPVEEQVDHNGDGTEDIDDWGSILWNAFPGRMTSFYLASGGPDLLFNCLINHTDNHDNIEMDWDKK